MTLIFDVETNGFDPTTSVFSFSALLLNENNEVVEEVDRYYHIQPGDCFNQEAIAINGLDPATIEAKRKEQSAEYPVIFGEDAEIKELFDKADRLIAHNIDFDRGFVEQHHGIDLGEKELYCTMRAAQYLYPAPYYKNGAPKFPKLSEAVDWAGVNTELIKEQTGKGFHDSLFDVYCTYELYLYLQSLGGEGRC